MPPVPRRAVELPILLVAAALAVATFVAYAPVRDNGFVRLDDYDYVSRNATVLRGLTLDGARWAFTTFSNSNWHPLTWLSHMLDCDLFRVPGANGATEQWAGGHHLVSVSLHAASSVFVFLLFLAMTGARCRSALLAGLFALHPVHVESVAWAAERKDVLSTTFGLLALLAYVGHTRRPARWRYAALLGCYALSLLSKPMLVTLPFAMLLLDYWPLRRFPPDDAADRRTALRALVREKVPLFVLAAVSSVVTLLAQRSGGAIVGSAQVGWADRVANAVVAYGRYVLATLWPRGLAVQYPHPIHWPAGTVVGALAGLLAITALAVLTTKRWPFLFVGWSWFLGTLVPVIGLVQVGGQSMADRYAYVPSIGLFVMLVWGIAAVLPVGVARQAAAVLAVGALVALGAATHRRALVWRDTETLLRDTLAKTPGNAYLEFLLGLELQERGAAGRALPHLEQFLDKAPDNARLLVRFAEAMGAVGRFRQAGQLYRRAYRLDPSSFPATSLSNFAYLLSASTDDAMRDGRLAVRLATRAQELSPTPNPQGLYVLATAQAEAGDFAQAADTARRAVDVARSLGQEAFAAAVEPRIAQFRAGRPSREIVVRVE